MLTMGISDLWLASTRSLAGELPHLLAALENRFASNSRTLMKFRRRTRGIVLAVEVEELDHAIKRWRVSSDRKRTDHHLFKINVYSSAHWILTSRGSVGMTWWTIEYGRVINIHLPQDHPEMTRIPDLVIKVVLMLEVQMEEDHIPRVEMWHSMPRNHVYL